MSTSKRISNAQLPASLFYPPHASKRQSFVTGRPSTVRAAGASFTKVL
jgi:hypothetical protein